MAEVGLVVGEAEVAPLDSTVHLHRDHREELRGLPRVWEGRGRGGGGGRRKGEGKGEGEKCSTSRYAAAITTNTLKKIYHMTIT